MGALGRTSGDYEKKIMEVLGNTHCLQPAMSKITRDMLQEATFCPVINQVFGKHLSS